MAVPSAYCSKKRDTWGSSNRISWQGDSQADYYPTIIYSDLLHCTTSRAVPVWGCSLGLYTASFDVSSDLRGHSGFAISDLDHDSALGLSMSYLSLWIGYASFFGQQPEWAHPISLLFYYERYHFIAHRIWFFIHSGWLGPSQPWTACQSCISHH